MCYFVPVDFPHWCAKGWKRSRPARVSRHVFSRLVFVPTCQSRVLDHTVQTLVTCYSNTMRTQEVSLSPAPLAVPLSVMHLTRVVSFRIKKNAGFKRYSRCSRLCQGNFRLVCLDYSGNGSDHIRFISKYEGSQILIWQYPNSRAFISSVYVHVILPICTALVEKNNQNWVTWTIEWKSSLLTFHKACGMAGRFRNITFILDFKTNSVLESSVQLP